MHREHQRWFSPRLQRDMELLAIGHAGAKGIGHRLHVWDGRAHRAHHWRRMLSLYVQSARSTASGSLTLSGLPKIAE